MRDNRKIKTNANTAECLIVTLRVQNVFSVHIKEQSCAFLTL